MGGAGGVPGGRGWVAIRLLRPILLLMQQSKKIVNQSINQCTMSINQTVKQKSDDGVMNTFVAVGRTCFSCQWVSVKLQGCCLCTYSCIDVTSITSTKSEC